MPGKLNVANLLRHRYDAAAPRRNIAQEIGSAWAAKTRTLPIATRALPAVRAGLMSLVPQVVDVISKDRKVK